MRLQRQMRAERQTKQSDNANTNQGERKLKCNQCSNCNNATKAKGVTKREQCNNANTNEAATRLCKKCKQTPTMRQTKRNGKRDEAMRKQQMREDETRAEREQRHRHRPPRANIPTDINTDTITISDIQITITISGNKCGKMRTNAFKCVQKAYNNSVQIAYNSVCAGCFKCPFH